MHLMIARNPDEASKLPYLLRVPLGDGLVFRTSDTWPRTKALYCHPVPLGEWPADPDIVVESGLRSCVRRGAAIDLVLDRGRENRSQIVFTQGRGRDMVFWQSARTRKQARPRVTTPTARAAGLGPLAVVVDAHERYAYRFSGQQVTTEHRALPCGDYAVEHEGRLVASVERKSLADLVGSLTGGKLKYALAELATLPRAAVVVEDRYSQVFALERVRPAVVADGLAEAQVTWPNVPIVFCENRTLAEEWTYRFLAAALVHARTDAATEARLATSPASSRQREGVPSPTDGASDAEAGEPEVVPTAQVRAWAREQGIDVPTRGRLRREVVAAWRAALSRRNDGRE